MSRLTLLLSALTAVLLLAQDAAGALIAVDEFLYGGNAALGQYTATPGSGRNHSSSTAGRIVIGSSSQKPANLGFTTSQSWQGQDTSLWKVYDGLGLSYDGLATSGGGLQYDWNTGAYTRLQHRDLAAAPTVNTGDTYYMTALMQYRANSADSNAYVWGGFTSGGANEADPDNPNYNDDLILGWRVGFVAKSGGAMDLVLRHRNSSGSAENLTLDDGVDAGETHLVLIRGTKGDGGVTTDDFVEVWVDPNVFSSEEALGTPSFSFYDKSMDATTPFAAMVAEASLYDRASSPAGVVLDQFYLGTSYRDVLPIPEPSTAAMLLGLGTIVLLGYFRSRQRAK